MEEYDVVKDILDGIFGEPQKYDDSKGQIAYDCPVCSHEIKGLDKGDGKGNLEVSLEKNNLPHCLRKSFAPIVKQTLD